jgi:hypothetical protein
MEKKDVEQLIKELTRDCVKAYPEAYPINLNGTATDVASMGVADIASSMFAERNVIEIKRDENLNITESDYVEWSMQAFSELISE